MAFAGDELVHVLQRTGRNYKSIGATAANVNARYGRIVSASD
jgi:hypothetical protein